MAHEGVLTLAGDRLFYRAFQLGRLMARRRVLRRFREGREATEPDRRHPRLGETDNAAG